jgi:uncharacterized phosphosugar-binding protein
VTDIADRYFAGVIDRLQEVRATEGPAIDRAAEACAASIAADKLVFSFGTGHGSLPALEMFPRTGTIVGFRPIVESTMISFHHVWGDMGARQYRFIHAVEGYGNAILRSHQLDPADTMVLFSHSGVNAVILDIALTAKEVGMKVIGVTSVQHSSASPSRHSSGQKLYEVADIIIDTHASLADASIRIDGLRAPVGANSTSITIAIAHAIVSVTAEKLVRRGLEPFVMVNPNTAAKEAANVVNDRNYEELWRRLKAR